MGTLFRRVQGVRIEIRIVLSVSSVQCYEMFSYKK